ncbi:MAG: response regulator transcription factor [Pseudomonadota bacterium]
MTTPYPILLVEDDDNTRQRLYNAVDNHTDLAIMKAASDLNEARTFLEQSTQQPRMGLIDIGLPDGSGLELIYELTTRANPVDCMVISTLGDERHVMAALSAGAAGYILKDDHIDEIGNSIITLIQGGSPISPKIARHLLKHFNQRLSGPAPEQETIYLTDRESDVLLMISKGYKRKEIADSLKISINTVGTHVNSIYRKLSANSNIEAVQTATSRGLL